MSNSVFDSGPFHLWSDKERVEFVNNLGAVLVPGGRYFMLCFNEREMRDGPRRDTKAQIRDTFRDGWTINDIRGTKFATLIHEGGASAWLATISRSASRYHTFTFVASCLESPRVEPVRQLLTPDKLENTRTLSGGCDVVSIS